MTETNPNKVQTVNTISKTVEVYTSQQQQIVDKKLITLKGILTSRIEVKPSSDIPAYGFFKFEDKEVDVPVVFRIKDQHNNWIKPTIKKGSSCELEGYFVDSKDKTRPSFTCLSYQILSEPKPLNTKDLITLTSGLLTTTLEKYKEWTNRKDFLFKKLEELKEIDTLSRLGENFLQAYLTLKKAQYANYQEKHLNSNFNLAHYLETISQEVHQVSKHIEAYQSKQITN